MSVMLDSFLTAVQDVKVSDALHYGVPGMKWGKRQGDSLDSPNGGLRDGAEAAGGGGGEIEDPFEDMKESIADLSKDERQYLADSMSKGDKVATHKGELVLIPKPENARERINDAMDRGYTVTKVKTDYAVFLNRKGK